MKKKSNRVTIIDIAREAGVSTQTVSRVVNKSDRVAESTRARVVELIQRLNYRPNRAARILASQQSHTIGLIIPNVANPYYPEVVHGIEAVAAEQGYSVLLYNTERQPERERKALELLEEYRVAGVVMCAAMLPDEELIPLLERQQAAVVINRVLPDLIAGRVMVDFKSGMIEAVHHLKQIGRSKLAFLSYEPSVFYSNPARKEGFFQGLYETGLDASSAVVAPCGRNVADGYEVTKKLIKEHPDVDGVICFNDIVAIGTLKGCAESNRLVPEDIAVIGCDNILMARYVSPALTSIGISQYDLGITTGKILMARIRKEKISSETIFTPKLIIRSSTVKGQN